MIDHFAPYATLTNQDNKSSAFTVGLSHDKADAVRMVRVLALLLLALQLVLIGATYYQIWPNHTGTQLGVRLIVAALVVLLFGVTFGRWFADHWRAATLGLCCLIIVVTTRNGWASHIAVPPFFKLVLLSLTSASLLPWGVRWQRALNLLCLLSLAILATRSPLPAPPTVTWATLLSALLLSEGIAGFMTRRRRQLDAQLRALAESEDKFRRIFQYSTDVISIVSLRDGKYIDVNEEFLRATGFTREEMIGKRHRDLNMWADPNDFERLNEEFLQAGSLINRETELKAKDGRQMWGLLSAAIIEIGGEHCALLVVRNITEWRRLQDELKSRASQEAAIAALGQRAIGAKELDAVMQEATAVIAVTLRVDYSKVLELLPDGETLLLRAGVGWREGTVGAATVEAVNSQAGYTLRSNEPVIVEDLRNASRFSGPKLLLDNGVISGMSVVIPGTDKPFGVLGAHTRSKRAFTRDDVNFIQAIANILAQAIERARADEELRRSEKYFRSVIENTADVITVLDLDETILFVNGSVKKAFGYEPVEMIGTSSFDFVHPDDVSRIRQVLANALQQPDVAASVECRLRHEDGSWKVCEVVGKVIMDAAGTLRIVASTRDITDRKQAERELRQSEEKFRRVFETSIDVISINSLADGKYIEVNDEFEKMTGYNRQEVFGRTPRQLKLWASDDELRKAMTELRDSGFVRNLEVDFLTKGGERRSSLFSARLVNFAEQRCILSFSRDITERKHAEELLRLTQFSVDHAGEAILWAKADGKLFHVNDAACRSLGYSRDELLSMGLGDFQQGRLAENGNIGRTSNWKELIENLRRTGAATVETQYLRKDGGVFPVEVSMSRMVFGGREYICAYARDISARKLAERAKELARSNAELEEFAHAISHDLREPLHKVGSYVDLLAKEYQGKPGGEADRYFRHILDGVTWMRSLINDLLAYSQATAERPPVEPTDFGWVVHRAITNLTMAIKEQKAAVTYEPMPTLVADRSGMTRVFQNLIENALKFHGQEPPKVHVGAERRGHEWLFFVRDNGIGIDPKHAVQIFTIFHRLHSRAKYPGTGIGLAICKKIIERHSGRIWIESKPGGGATFYFTIPADCRDNAPSRMISFPASA